VERRAEVTAGIAGSGFENAGDVHRRDAAHPGRPLMPPIIKSRKDSLDQGLSATTLPSFQT
jgi:hypothetical protein